MCVSPGGPSFRFWCVVRHAIIQCSGLIVLCCPVVAGPASAAGGAGAVAGGMSDSERKELADLRATVQSVQSQLQVRGPMIALIGLPPTVSSSSSSGSGEGSARRNGLGCFRCCHCGRSRRCHSRCHNGYENCCETPFQHYFVCSGLHGQAILGCSHRAAVRSQLHSGRCRVAVPEQL